MDNSVTPYRIVVVLTLALLVVGSGCARKTAGNPSDPAPGAADTPAAAPAGMVPSQVTGEPIEEPATAAIDDRRLPTVYFDFDSYTLKPEAMRVLEENAAWLRENPRINLVIEGHCDERGSDEYNLALGERRAAAVQTYLATLGIAGERLGTVSYGEEKPAAAGHDEPAWEKNRRAEFR